MLSFIFQVFPWLLYEKERENRFSPFKMTPGKAKVCKPFSVYVFLVNKDCTSTPSPDEELELSQAGLGKRSLNLTEDMTHLQV